MSDITLTSGIRQNLLSLQNTSAELTTTQEALATGDAVNSAEENPSAYFTSQNLTNTANSLSALLDQIGQGQQTIDAATNGLTGITSLLQQALSTVQQAQQASQSAGGLTGTVSIASSGSLIPAAGGTLTITVGSSSYSVAIASSSTLATIENDINTTTGLGSAGALTATDNGSGDLVLTANSGSSNFSVTGALATTLGVNTGGVYGSSSTRTTLQSNYNGLLTQINQLAGDASYNGVNLLTGNNLTIDFNPTGTSSLTIDGVNFNSAGLSLNTVSGSVANSFQDNTALANTVTAINAAITQVQTQTETFGTNSAVIGTRQTFETNMISTLQTGASNLVVADQNLESTDLLTEQTQQQLEISALSIANQANQSVLKLFG
jgi:flagellin